MVLDREGGGSAGGTRQVIVLFGVGLIGGSVLRAIEGLGPVRRYRWPFSWGRTSRRRVESEAVLDGVWRLAGGGGGSSRINRLDVVWCAGKGGFASNEEQLAPELEAFEEVLALSGRLYEGLRGVEGSFHLVSSAGGLFEGQRWVQETTRPLPLRAYARAKLSEEERLGALPGDVRRVVYRASSVYGYRSEGRTGLIATLIQNGIQNRTTRIFGNTDTVRDYVFADDVGRFVADKVVLGGGWSRTLLLASGKPSSMTEVLRRVECTVGRRLYVQFEPNPSNARPNSVRPSALPRGWHPTPLEVGIARTGARIENAFLKDQGREL